MTFNSLFLTLCLLMMGSFSFAGEEDLFGDGSNPPKDAVQGAGQAAGQPATSPPVILSGSLDLRSVHTGTDTNWKYGGPGITAYGPLPGNSGTPDESFKVPRIAVTGDFFTHSALSAHVQINYDDLPDPRENDTNIGITEGYARYSPSDQIKIRAGILIPPVSLEHSSRAWSTLYSITPSAINTWIGEEIRPIAVEADFSLFHSRDSDVHLLVAPFSNNEPSGSILAWRGWAFHDYQYRVGSRLKLQNDVPTALSSSGWDTPFEEIDGRVGLYGKLSWKLNDQWRFEGFYLDNMATGTSQNPASIGGDFAWATHFGIMSVEWNPDGPFTFVSQALYGTSRIQNATTNLCSIDYYAVYGLLTYKAGVRNRFTFRFDQFHVNDLDSFSDNNNQAGTAELYAYIFNIADNQSLQLEYLHPDTRRQGNSGLVNGDASDDLYQIGYRVLF